MTASKYHNKKTEIDGIRFDSKKEAERYCELKLLLKAGAIKHLKLQPRFLLQPMFYCDGNWNRKLEYIADFQYEEGSKTVVEDVKGLKTDVYKIKKKLFLYKYGDQIEFREI